MQFPITTLFFFFFNLVLRVKKKRIALNFSCELLIA